MLIEDAEGDGRGEGEAATLLLTLSLRYVLIFWCNVVSIGVSAGEDAEAEIFPRSSADLDQGLRDMLRRSPRPRENPACGGEEGVRPG